MPLPTLRMRTGPLVAGTVVIIVGYAAFVAAVPLTIYPDLPRPPGWIMRPAGLFILLALPAALLVVGTFRRAASVIVVGAIICFFQSFVAFSGATFGFLVPSLLLFAIAFRVPTSDRIVSGGPALIALFLAIGGWFALISMTEPRCYETRQTSDGSVVTIEVPAAGSLTRTASGTGRVGSPGPDVVVGGGCSSAETTLPGLAVTAILAIGAVGIVARWPRGVAAPAP